MMITPLDIALLLKIYATPTKEGQCEQPALRRLLDAEMIWFEDHTVVVTERGKVFCQHIHALPLPVQTWGMPGGDAN